MNLIEIDGSHGEGGGQIIRTALAFSILTQKPIKVFNIRIKRPKPGLHVQLAQIIKALEKLCDAKIKGVEVGSKEIEFYPNEIKESKLSLNIPTAASIGLILQALQLACVFSKHSVDIDVKGGASFGKFAPPIPYLQYVTLPTLEKMGYKIELKIIREGFYPKGGAEADIKIYPLKKLNPLKLEEQGEVDLIKGISVASKFLEKSRVAERQRDSAFKVLLDEFEQPPDIHWEYCETYCPGSGIVLWLKTNKNIILGSDSVGELGVRAEALGEKAAKELVECYKSGATVDKHLSDQLIPFMALAGNSIIKVPEITNHCKTNVWLVEKFLPVKFKIEKNVISV